MALCSSIVDHWLCQTFLQINLLSISGPHLGSQHFPGYDLAQGFASARLHPLLCIQSHQVHWSFGD